MTLSRIFHDGNFEKKRHLPDLLVTHHEAESATFNTMNEHEGGKQ
jgi:hypothetical protein